MAYLIELDPLYGLIRFPQPDESSPFHPNAPRNPNPPEPEVAAAGTGMQLELGLPDISAAASPKEARGTAMGIKTAATKNLFKQHPIRADET